jgi:tetratricopeptide (TPR) repeat protein
LWEGRESKSSTRRRATIAVVGLTVWAALLLRTRDQVHVWRDSDSLWEYVLRHAPNTALAHSNYAVLLNDRGESQRARAHAERAIDIYPANPTSHSALARACFDLGLYDEAEREYLLALEIDPDKTNRMISLAMVYTKQERFADAERVYRHAIALEPEEAGHRFNLGGLLASLERWDEAGALFDEAIRLDPEYVEAYFRAGVVRREGHDWSGAARVWREGLTRAPRDNQICAALSFLLATCPAAEIRDGGEALQLARIAVEDSHGQNLRAREALAAALARTGDFEGAAETAQAILDSADPALHDEMRERIEKALASYRNRDSFADEPGQPNTRR